MKNPQKKILSLPIAIALMLLLVGTYFRIMHWPYGLEINLASLFSISILYGIRYTAKSRKTHKDTLKLLMVVTYVIITYLAILKFTNLLYLNYASLIFGAGWFILEIIDIIKPKEVKEKLNPVLWIGIILIILHVLFKIMHWPFAGPIYILGILLSSLGFLIDYSRNKKNQ
jgi:asparagine N-glycosylation enzyme membrane subunit Stt3